MYIDIKEWVKYYGKNHDEFQLPFNFGLMFTNMESYKIKDHVLEIEKITKNIGWPNYVLGNHDKPRLATRFGDKKA